MTAGRVVASLLLLWAALGVVHTGFAMARRNGWALERSDAARRTLGLPDEARAPLVAGVRAALAGASEPGPRVVAVLPASADTFDVIYLRYQLAHLEYPLRVAVVRDVPEIPLPPRVPAGETFVVIPGDRTPPFRVAATGDTIRR